MTKMVATKRDWLGNRSMLALYGKEIKVGYREKVGYNDENMKWNWHTFGRKSKGQIVKKNDHALKNSLRSQISNFMIIFTTPSK